MVTVHRCLRGEVPRIHLPRTPLNRVRMAVSGRACRIATRDSALVGLLPEPLHGRRALVEYRDVPVIRAQPQFCRGAAAREPLAVRAGHYPIPATVQEQSRGDHLRGVESPRGDEGEVVVY